MRLEGQVAIVTGGGGGIGKATCLAFAREGADIVIPEVNIANAEAVSTEITTLGRQCFVIETDVADGASVRKMVQETLEAFGRIDILVNNAGIFSYTRIDACTEAEWDRMMAVNLKGPFLLFSGGDGNDEGTKIWQDYQPRFFGGTGGWLGRICTVFCLKSGCDVSNEIIGTRAWRVRYHG